MRLYPENIEALFHRVSVGITVYIVNDPYKAGWSKEGKLYLESHIPWENKDNATSVEEERIRHAIQLASNKAAVNVEWENVMHISEEMQGIPQVIGDKGKSL